MNESDPKAEFRERFGVSRETCQRLARYHDLVITWNKTINLVSRSTVTDIWTRHFSDSAEIFAITGVTAGRWLDLGSGGGFPGAVIAILAAEKAPGLAVTCVESDVRKCEFIRTVSRATGVPIAVMSRRIEEVPPQNAQVVSARALAPLPRLLEHVARHIAPDGVAALHKGETWRDEVNNALERWRFTVEKHDNPTAENSVILKLGDIARG